MDDLRDFNSALGAVYDAATPTESLTSIAQLHANLRHQVAVHPNADAQLLDWLDGLGDPNVCQVVAARRARALESYSPPASITQPDASVRQPVGRRRAAIGVSAAAGCLALAVVVALSLRAPAPMTLTPVPHAPTISAPNTTNVPPSASDMPSISTYGTFGGSSPDVFYGVAAADGWFVVVGYTASQDGDFAANYSGDDAVVARVQEGVGLSWARTFGGDGDDVFYAVALDAQGNIYAVGQTASYDGDFPVTHGDGTDAVVVKLTQGGDVVWAKTFGGSGDESFQSAVVTPDGNLVVTGFTTSGDGPFPASRGGQDALIVTLDADGNIVLAKTLGGTGDEQFVNAAVAANGDIIAVGRSNSSDGDFPNSNRAVNAVIVDVSANGELMWARSFGGTKWDEFNGVTIAPSGYLVVAGDTSSPAGDFGGVEKDSTGGVMARLDPGGTIDDLKVLRGTPRAVFTSAAVSPDGTAYWAGTGTVATDDSASAASTLPSAILAAETSYAAMTQSFGGTGDDGFTAMTIMPDGTIVAVGYTSSTDGTFPTIHGGDNTDGLIVTFT